MNFWKKLFGAAASMNFDDPIVRKQIWTEYHHAWIEASVRQMQMGITDNAQVDDLSMNIAKALVQKKYPISDSVLLRIVEDGTLGKLWAPGDNGDSYRFWLNHK